MESWVVLRKYSSCRNKVVHRFRQHSFSTCGDTVEGLSSEKIKSNDSPKCMHWDWTVATVLTGNKIRKLYAISFSNRYWSLPNAYMNFFACSLWKGVFQKIFKTFQACQEGMYLLLSTRFLAVLQWTKNTCINELYKGKAASRFM